MKNKHIQEWEKATEDLKDYFIKKYFNKDADWYWISDQIGEVLFVNDYFFSLTDIVDYIKYKYTFEEMSEHYYYSLECHNKKESPINIKNYKKIK